jgi:hypothetical protein
VFGVSASTDVDQRSARGSRIIRLSGFAAAALVVLIFLLTFVALSPPSPYLTLLIISVAGWVILGIAWVVQLLSAHGTRWGRWPFPALALLVIVLASFGVPGRLTYLASRGAMNRAAHDVMTGKRDPAKIQWIGLYPVSNAYGDHYGFWFSVRGTRTGTDCLGDIDNDSGFVFSASFKDAISSAPENFQPLSHLSGNWYSYDSWCGSA